MTDELKEMVIEIARLADEICDRFSLCSECPLYQNRCTISHAMGVAYEIKRKDELTKAEEKEKRNREATHIRSVEDLPIDYLPIDKEPTYEDLPIDLDDDYHCDECCKPVFNECLTDKYNEDCPYGLGECCEDNLATNVGRICFDHNLPTNFAMAIIEIIQKERDRNEYLHLYRKHIPAE